jgi:hypothetical protein
MGHPDQPGSATAIVTQEAFNDVWDAKGFVPCGVDGKPLPKAEAKKATEPASSSKPGGDA